MSTPTPRKDTFKDFRELAKKNNIKVGRPPSLRGRTVEIYVRQYLASDEGVKDFKKWAAAKPGEAIPWAWKAVYGDNSQVQIATKNQINVLIQVLTGKTSVNVPRGTIAEPTQSFPLPDIQGKNIPQDIVCQTIDTQDIVEIKTCPEKKLETL